MKKTVSIILCAALSLAVLTACGSPAATPTPTPEPVLVPEPTTEATPEPTAEPKPTPTPTPEPTPEPVSDPLVMYKDILDVYAQALTENYGGEELPDSCVFIMEYQTGTDLEKLAEGRDMLLAALG